MREAAGSTWTVTGLPEFGGCPPTPLRERVIRFCRSRPQSRWGRRQAHLARRLALAGLDAPLDVDDTYGLRLRLHPKDNLCEKRVLFTPQLFDPEERAFLDGIVTPGFRFADIGANVGLYALYVAVRAGPAARIVAIEPQPALLERLRFNIAINGFEERIAVLPIAVGDAPGTLEMTIDRRNRGHAGDKVSTGETISVPVRPLADALAEAGMTGLDALKIDIEGGEDLALLPYLRSLDAAGRPRHILIESSPHLWREDCIEACLGLGYEIGLRARRNVVLSLRAA